MACYDALKDKSVLVVDDNELITSLLAEALGRCGSLVVRTHSGQAALDVLAARHFDLLLLDVRMTGMSGWDILAEVKRSWPHLVGKTIIMTGDGFQMETTQMIANQRLPVLHKPFGLEDLRSQASQILQKASQPSCSAGLAAA
jgi:DNA-binding NtrC family response regulator